MIQKIKAWSQQNSHRQALVIDDKSYTYGDLLRMVNQTTLDSKSSDVCFIVEHCPLEQLVTFLAALSLSIKPVICHPNLSPEVRLALASEASASDLRLEADFGILTSGTSGKPKILWRTMSSWVDFFAEQNRIFHINQKTALFLKGNFSFSGNLNMALAVLYEGGQLIISDKPSPRSWMQLCQTCQVSHLYLLPSLLQVLASHLNSRDLDLSYIISSSQTLPVPLIRDLYDRQPTCDIIVFYGASELSFISWCKGREILDNPNLVGRAFKNVQIKLKNNKIYVTTPYAAVGVRCPYTVEDYGHFSKAGLILEGRPSDWANYAGTKLHLPTIRQKLLSCSFVKDAFCLKLSSYLAGDEVHAFLVLKDSISLSEAKKSIASVLLATEQPKYWHTIDAIPLMDSSKVDVQHLKKLCQKRTH